MLYALVEQQKQRAMPQICGKCPGCQENLIPKCGEIKTWHWAHRAGDCDPWYEPESEWHQSFKALMPPEQTEVTIRRDGKTHRADIVAVDGTVVELQHSSISSVEIREREDFYGKIAWLFDAREWHFKHSLWRPPYTRYEYVPSLDSINNAWDLDKLLRHVGIYGSQFHINNNYYMKFSEQIEYYRPYVQPFVDEARAKNRQIKKEADERNKLMLGKHIFDWLWAHKSLEQVKGLLFFDLGNDQILNVHNINWQRSPVGGSGVMITHAEFIEMMRSK